MRSIRLTDIVSCTHGRLIKKSKKPVNGLLIKGISTDTRDIKRGDLFVALKGKNFNGHDFLKTAQKQGALSVIVSQTKQIKIPVIKVKDTLHALGDIASFYRTQIKAKKIAITGSNGKTTTKEMLFHILSKKGKSVCSPKSFNNAIGVPLTMFLVKPRHKYAIFEVGTNHPGEIKYLANIIKPDISIITNISATHLEGLKTVYGVAKEKASLLEALSPDGVAIVDINNRFLRPYLKKVKGKVVFFSTKKDKKAEVYATRIRNTLNGIKFTVNNKHECSLNILGSWNVQNALAALTSAKVLGVNLKRAVVSLKTFKASKMRMEKEMTGKITFINDAYNANPQSVKSLLEDLNSIYIMGRKILVFGDMMELGAESVKYHKEIGRRIADTSLDALFVVGKESSVTAQEAHKKMLMVPVFYFKSVSDVGNYLANYIKQGDLVVFKGSRSVGLESALERAKKAVSNK